MGRTNVASGMKINGIIEEHKVAAGENISASDFVSIYTDNFKSNCTRETPITYKDNYSVYAQSIKLNEKQFLIEDFVQNYSAPTRIHVCTLTENSSDFNVTSSTQIINGKSISQNSHILIIDDNRFIVVYGYFSSGYNKFGYELCKVEDSGNVTIIEHRTFDGIYLPQRYNKDK